MNHDGSCREDLVGHNACWSSQFQQQLLLCQIEDVERSGGGGSDGRLGRGERWLGHAQGGREAMAAWVCAFEGVGSSSGFIYRV